MPFHLFQAVLACYKIRGAGEQIIQDAEIGTKLAALKSGYPDYAEAMENLYQRIKDMQDYGNTLPEEEDDENENSSRTIVINLANTLKNDTNQFLIENQDTPPDRATYEAFKEKFTTRLHSADDVMSQQGDKLWFIIGNLLFALFLIPQLIQSKIRHGHYSLFFSGTTKQQHVCAIHDSVSAIPVRSQ